jgi:hypothetical protein
LRGEWQFLRAALSVSIHRQPFLRPAQGALSGAGNAAGILHANAYFSVANYSTRSLTVYDGVSYGFQNFVTPEPGAWVLFVSGFGAILIGRWKRARG